MCAVSHQEAKILLRKAPKADPEGFWDTYGFDLTDGKIPPAAHMNHSDRTNPVEGSPNGRPHQLAPQYAFGSGVPARRP